MGCSANDWFAGWTPEAIASWQREIDQEQKQVEANRKHEELINTIKEIALKQAGHKSQASYYKEVADKSTRLLCEICGVLKDKELEHLFSSELRQWYKNHLKEDEIRRLRY